MFRNNSRRQFLSFAGTSALVSLSPVVPNFLLRAAAAEEKTSRGENVLVVLQLSGGNDGLNTVVPFQHDEYRRSRPTLAIPANQVLKIDSQLGFHPSLRGLAGLLEAGRLAILQGVGYPNPNRSHFESMDIWHTARQKADGRQLGWLGRYLDAAQASRAGQDAPALHFGGETQPLALAALHTPVPSVRSVERFRLEFGGNGSLRQAIEADAAAERPAQNDLLQFVQASTVSAISSSRRVEQATKDYTTAVKYPGSNLANKLKTVAQLIDAGLSTRIYYVTLDGFDTHSTQAAAHAGLLTELGDALAAFLDDLSQHDHINRVLTMTFSEFGRRVKENASLGTDHGAAAPLFLAGGRVKPGLHGDHPKFTDLDDGDLKHHTDFRRVYADVLQNWLGSGSGDGKSEKILGDRFPSLNVVA